jgi:hypothetical protein
MDRLFLEALRKLTLYQRVSRAEAKALRRRRLADGTYPLPKASDATRRLGFHFSDPRVR